MKKSPTCTNFAERGVSRQTTPVTDCGSSNMGTSPILAVGMGKRKSVPRIFEAVQLDFRLCNRRHVNSHGLATDLESALGHAQNAPVPAREGTTMDEYVRRQYLKEEDFLEAYYGLVDEVLPHLGHEWQPNYRCEEATRQRRDILLARGKLVQLTFDSAALFCGQDGLSSIRLYLRSSARFVVARIHWVEGETRVEILTD